VATSNAGAIFVREQVKNGITGNELQKMVVEYIQKEGIFSPEFLNRFDGVVVFEPLNKENLELIAKLMLEGLKRDLIKKNINLDFDQKVIEKLVKDGYDIEFGARPMKRIVELVLGDLIGVAILKNEVKAGDKIKLVVDEEDKFVIEKM
jgi:ATP-dependent Clp protease ATP-binding subunit ClpC